MYNVKAAVSRLAFAPKPKEMDVTDIATGHFVFAPVPGEKVSYLALEKAIENAGYEIEDAALTVSGEVTDERHLRTPDGQVFHFISAAEGPEAKLAGLEPGWKVTVSGAWKTSEGVEIVVVTEVRSREAEGG